MSFVNWSLMAKVSVLLCARGVGALGSMIYAGQQMYAIDDSYSELLNGETAAAINLAKANRSLTEVGASMYWNAAASTDEDNAAAAKQRETADGAFRKSMQTARQSSAGIGSFAEDVIKRYNAAMRGDCGQVVRLSAATDDAANAEALSVMGTKCRPLLDELKATLSSKAEELASKAVSISVANTHDTRLAVWVSLGAIGGVIVGILALAFFVLRWSTTRPLGALMKTMKAMQDGDYTVEVPSTRRKDEIGAMARGLEAFRAGLSEAAEARQEQEAAKAHEEATVRRRAELAEQFVARMETLSSGFAQSSNEVADAASNLSATADETSRQAQIVSGAAEEASTNVQTVAAGTEELSASIREISLQVSQSAAVSEAAAKEAEASSRNVQALADSARQIGEVVELISNIAAQTNLLALNATIEAARAGEAGRGFAVVASEVKDLASQTAKATDEISRKISEIQSATDTAVGSIARIVNTIGSVRQSATAIAGAVEQQEAATNEIAVNTQKAAQGTADVTGNIAGVGTAAEMTGSASTQLMGLSKKLSAQSEELQQEVGAFVANLKAA